MRFQSILFEKAGEELRSLEPDFFSDLHLDEVVASLTAGLDEFKLEPIFYTPLRSVVSITYRQEIMQALEVPDVRQAIVAFGAGMRRMREYIAESERLTYRYQTARVFLDAVNTYCDAIEELERALGKTPLEARGLRALHEYLSDYMQSVDFRLMVTETKRLSAALAGITYTLDIEGLRVTVSRYAGEPDYGSQVFDTFEKFRQGRAADYTFSFPSGARLNSVEEAILDRVAKLHPAIFASLIEFCDRHQHYLDELIRAVDREFYFYTACLNYMGAFKSAGISSCYPGISTDPPEDCAQDFFDAALATRLMKDKKKRVVGNDFHLARGERVIVVSGANQGGKTTFARALGQVYYLALLGCAVPARTAQLSIVDAIFTHFEREEDVQNLTGKLELDLQRIHEILANATRSSLLIMNETFSSTTLADALFLSREVLTRIVRLGMLCVTVTFFDELAADPKVVSMVAGVDESDQAVRTFKLTRRPAEGRAYAATLARKYRLTSADLKARLRL